MTASSWTLRPADSKDDCAALALVGGATFLETFSGVLNGPAIVLHCQREHNPDRYAGFLRDGAHAWLGETADGHSPIGFALLSKPDLPASAPGDLELKRIYVLSGWHGSGLGAALMAAAVDRAIAKGAGRLLLGVYAGNARAQRFYGKNGFVPIAERQFRVGDRDYEDIVFAKTLGDRQKGQAG